MSTGILYRYVRHLKFKAHLLFRDIAVRFLQITLRRNNPTMLHEIYLQK